MKKKELKAEIRRLKYKGEYLKAMNTIIGEGLKTLSDENKTLKKELASLKAMDLTESYKTIESENKKSLWFGRMDSLISDVINLTNELKSND